MFAHYNCNNPNTFKITNNEHFNIFFDANQNIVFIKGSDKCGNIKQIKIGSYLQNSSNCCNSKLTDCSSSCNINFNPIDMFKYIGIYDSYNDLVNKTQSCVNNFSFALVNDKCNKKIKLYLYANNIWNENGTIFDMTNLYSNESICTYSTCSSTESANLKYQQKVTMCDPEFIESHKIKQIYVNQLNDHFAGQKFYIKFNTFQNNFSNDKCITTGKYIVCFNISFYYSNIHNFNQSSHSTLCLSDTNTICSEIQSQKQNICSHSNLSETQDKKPDTCLDDTDNGKKNETLIMICKINKDNIEIISSSIKHIPVIMDNYPISINHNFMNNFMTGDNIIFLICPLFDSDDKIKLNIIQDATFVTLDKIK